MTEVEKREILRIALFAGEIILKNGGETYRVEDTINIICSAKGLENVNSFVVPTGIFVSDDRFDGISFIKRIKSRSIDLDKVSKTNNFARAFVSDKDYSNTDALDVLKGIDTESSLYGLNMKYLAAGCTSAFFSLLFGGGFFDFLAAFIIPIIAMAAYEFLDRMSDTMFLTHIVSSSIISLFSILFSLFLPEINIDKVIVGSIMPFVPGVALTNGLRDSISGELVSGASKIFEAFLVALSIAIGAGTVLNIWIKFLGGSL